MGRASHWASPQGGMHTRVSTDKHTHAHSLRPHVTDPQGEGTPAVGDPPWAHPRAACYEWGCPVQGPSSLRWRGCNLLPAVPGPLAGQVAVPRCAEVFPALPMLPLRGQGVPTSEAILAQAVELILSGGYAGGAVQAGPAVAGRAVIALGDAPALQEAVGDVHLLPIDRHLGEGKGDAVSPAHRLPQTQCPGPLWV